MWQRGSEMRLRGQGVSALVIMFLSICLLPYIRFQPANS